MIGITRTMSSWRSQSIRNSSVPAALVESQPESSIVDNTHPKLATDDTIKSNYFPVGGRFYFTLQMGRQDFINFSFRNISLQKR